jgi:hypothetical protein
MDMEFVQIENMLVMQYSNGQHLGSNMTTTRALP